MATIKRKSQKNHHAKIAGRKNTKTQKKTQNKKKKQNTQHKWGGGTGMDITADMQSITNSESYKSNVLPSASSITPTSNIGDIKNLYLQNSNSHLVDIIYNLPQPGQNVQSVIMSQLPVVAWNHFMGDIESITGGRPGIHLYITESSQSAGDWKLLGIFINNGTI